MAKSANPTDGVFTGVSIYVNGFTDPSHSELKEIMLANGGRFENYYARAAVTHVGGGCMYI